MLDEIGQKILSLIREKCKGFDRTIRCAKNFDEYRYYCGRLEGIEEAERIVLKYFNDLYEIKPVFKEIEEVNEKL